MVGRGAILPLLQLAPSECTAPPHSSLCGLSSQGAGSIFYSAAPDDVHNDLCVRLAYPYKRPTCFPATWPSTVCRALQRREDVDVEGDEVFGLRWVRLGPVRPCERVELHHDALAEQLKSKTTFKPGDWDALGVGELREDHFIWSDGAYFAPALHRVKLREAALQRLASNNPIATTAVFQHLMRNMRTNLIGLSSARLTNEPLEARSRRGIWGQPTCNRDVVECNDRASRTRDGARTHD